MKKGLGALLLGALMLGACSDRTPEIDAELAADLQLATTQAGTPEFNDGPVDAPAPKVEAPKPKPVIPRPKTVAPRPRAQTPAPRVERPEPVRVVEVSRAEPQPSVESRVPSAGRGILAGASFGLSTGSQVCTNNRPGDKLVATVTNAVIGEDGTAIPVGSTVVLEVASVTPGSSPEQAQLALRVRSVVIDGQAHPVSGDVAIGSGLERGPAQPSGSDKKKVIGGAIAGAVIGQVMGRDTRSTVIGAAAGAAAGTGVAMATRKYHACLPAGSSVRVTTSQPIIL